MDDVPDKQSARGFLGFDNATDPTKLPEGILSEGLNVWCRGDGYVETRPGLRVNCNFPSFYVAGPTYPYWMNSDLSSRMIKALGYYDAPGSEYLFAFHNYYYWSVPNSGNNATPTNRTQTFIVTNPNNKIYQLGTKLFYLTPAGQIWGIDVGGGSFSQFFVATFSDGSTMPAWTRLAVHGFRVMAYDAASNKMYASAIGAADTSANWVKTENIRVGEGDGDPAMEVTGSQGGFLTLLNEGSVYQVDTSQASVANWTSVRVTKAVGCVEGKTAVTIGQDVFFLSRYGVVNLGSLKDTISISPSATLSAPVQKYIDRINWSSIGNAFATTWGDLYLIALPLDSDTFPRHVLPFHLINRQWQAPWYYGLADNAHMGPGVGPYPLPYVGLCTACVTNFAGKKETIFGDTCGRLLRIDDTAQTDETNVGVYATISSWVQTRRMDHGNPQSRKEPFFAELIFQDTTALAVLTGINSDGTAAATAAGDFTATRKIGAQFDGAGGLQKKRWLTRGMPPYYESALQVFATSGKLKLREANHSAFVDPPYFT